MYISRKILATVLISSLTLFNGCGEEKKAPVKKAPAKKAPAKRKPAAKKKAN